MSMANDVTTDFDRRSGDFMLQKYGSDKRRDYDTGNIAVLSAETQQQLNRLASQLLNDIKMKGYSDDDLDKICYTLQLGREHMKFRLALIVTSIKDLIQKISIFLEDKDNFPDIFWGESNTYLSNNGEELENFIKSLVEHGKYSSIADLWVRGGNIDWSILYENVEEALSFISLPTYPFEKERYWIKTVIDTKSEEKKSEQAASDIKNSQEEILLKENYRNIIVLSARTKKQLDQMVYRLLDNIKQLEDNKDTFHDICYTLQIGREHMQVRLALTADSVSELCQKLNDYLQNEAVDIYLSDENSADLAFLDDDDELQEFIENLIRHEKLHSVAKLWTKGVTVNWNVLYEHSAKIPSLISLPTYPFEKERYWIKEVLEEDTKRGKQESKYVDSSENIFNFDKRNTGISGLEENSYKLMTFEEIWKETILQKQVVQDIGNLIVFLSDEDKCEELKNMFHSRGCKNIIFVKNGTENKELSEECFVIDYEEKDSYLQCFYEIKKRWNDITHILYLWDLDKASIKNDWTGIVYLLQTLYECDFAECKLILGGEYHDILHRCYLESWIGLTRSMKLVIPDLMIRTISWDSKDDQWLRILWDEMYVEEDTNIIYEKGVRKTTKVVPSALESNYQTVLKDRGTYLITGGLGGLGIIFAKWLAGKYHANLVLVGRSDSDSKKDLLDEIRETGSSILYVQADVCNTIQMQRAVEEAHKKFGKIDGVIHAAGLEGSSSIIEKNIQEFNQILAANIEGTLVLDNVFSNENIDFICYFSSNAAIIGDFGAGCYAAGKRFEMAYAKNKKDNIRRIAVNWPLWDSTGMKLADEQGNDMYMKSSGQKLLGSEEGTAIFEKILGQNNSQYLVMYGLEKKIYQFLGIPVQAGISKGQNGFIRREEKDGRKDSRTGLNVKQCSISDIKDIVSSIIKIEADKLTITESFANFGFDSILLASLADRICEFYKIKVTPDIFFSYPNIDKLCGYLLKKYTVKLEAFYKKATDEISRPEEEISLDRETISQNLIKDIKDIVCNVIRIMPDKLGLNDNFADFGFDSISLAKLSENISSYFSVKVTANIFFNYPNINKLADYLMHKYEEKIFGHYKRKGMLIKTEKEEYSPRKADSVTVNKECPVSDPAKNFAPDIQENRKPISIIGMSGRFPDSENIDELWEILESGREVLHEIPDERKGWTQLVCDGELQEKRKIGVIPGISEFEPLFFEIAPRDAEKMDPRQRLLLQETWKALEDAGYGKELLESDRIGMFVGAEEGDYSDIVGDKSGITSNSISVLPARLAYFLNLHGPNMAIDTACSSGLTALHQACLSIWMGECDAAIVAGVSVLATGNAYKMMESSKMLSQDGRCYAFDKRANGMVPAEAIAVVVIKREDKAKKDKNPIYANIIGSGINYDGKTNGITAPNGNSQANLLKEVYERFSINPQKISYIVTHGTGTKLGDPIEINALTDAFKSYAVGKEYCALTSVKPNIGHSLAASGLVSLISLVMAMKKECIPASINCETLNDYIDWEDSPFYINRAKKEWKRIENKRIGCVSAFGMSGTNVHLVVEDYDQIEKKTTNRSMEKPYYLINLSAKTKESLEMIIKNLLNDLETDRITETDMPALSYTLMQGRQHFNQRYAIVARDKADVIFLLKEALHEKNHPDIISGRVKKDFIPESRIQQSVFEFIKDGMTKEQDDNQYKAVLLVLADLYCKGYDEVCKGMWGKEHPVRISLPTYPFIKENYWITEQQKSSKVDETLHLHPMLQKNVLDKKGQKFTTVFRGDELYLDKKI